MSAIRVILAFLLLVMMFPAMNLETSPVMPDCSTYTDYHRVSVEDQAWWMAAPGQNGNDFGHIHSMTCFPLAQTVKGIVPLDIMLTMHENPGKLSALTIQIGSDGKYVAARKVFKPALTCSTTCTWNIHMDADTRGFPYDGSQEVRIRPVVVEPTGDQLVGSTSYQVDLSNGKPRKDYRNINYIQAKGWYTNVQYAQSRVTGGYPYDRPVSGILSLNVACDSSKLPVTGCMLTVDPDFHNGNNGIVQMQTNGPFKGTAQIDTRNLANGMHKIVIRTDVKANGAGFDNTLSGLLGLWVNVNN